MAHPHSNPPNLLISHRVDLWVRKGLGDPYEALGGGQVPMELSQGFSSLFQVLYMSPSEGPCCPQEFSSYPMGPWGLPWDPVVLLRTCQGPPGTLLRLLFLIDEASHRRFLWISEISLDFIGFHKTCEDLIRCHMILLDFIGLHLIPSDLI